MVNPLGTTGAIISPHELPHASSFVELVPFFNKHNILIKDDEILFFSVAKYRGSVRIYLYVANVIFLHAVFITLFYSI
jgi:hypothetical protein